MVDNVGVNPQGSIVKGLWAGQPSRLAIQQEP